MNLYILIDTATGQLLANKPYKRSEPVLDLANNKAEVLWVEEDPPQYDETTHTLEPYNRAEPWPYQEGVTQWVQGWQAVAKPLVEVKATAKNRVSQWKVAKQDQPFPHTDGRSYPNNERDRINLSGAVNLAILESLTNRPGPPTPPMSVKQVATDGTVTDMDKDAVTALGLSALSHMQTIQEQAIQAEADIDAAVDITGVQAVLDGLP